MTLWVLASLGHFLLTWYWLARQKPNVSRDELWFQTMVLGMGTLLVSLHAVATTAGLSIARVALVLAAGHVMTAYASRKRGNVAGPESRSGESNRTERALELAAAVTLAAIVIQWTLASMESAGVSGSDAAHYHIPNAVNLALGGSPFDLPPTSHLYPMGSSMLAAWFLLPLKTTLLTDLVMVVPFLLLVSSAGWAFRQLTTLSGLSWSTWMMLALFATPLFRSASLMSADLLFAAATLAFAAATMTPLLRRTLTRMDVWLIAMSLGLLLGSKVTGFIAAALIGGPALLALVMVRPRFNVSLMAVPASLVAILGAGGIWLVRNWWIWGSPFAPNGVVLFGITVFPGAAYEATNYLSVLGDLSEKSGYQLWDRIRHFSSVWLSSWYLPGLGAMALIAVDRLVCRARGIASSPVRLWAAASALSTGAILGWFLIGAPWTSLEWTAGFSLRYALPWLVILPVVAWTAFFPASLPWYRNPIAASVAGVALSAGCLAIFAAHQQVDYPPWPAPAIILLSIAVVGAPYALQVAAPRWRWLLVIGALVPAAVLIDAWSRKADTLAQEARAAAMAAGPRTLGEQIYDAALARESADGQSCDATGRRFFITNRFDEAGALQGPRLTNQVLYAARDVKVTARVRPSMGRCDYLITERVIMETDKGAMLHAGLNTSGRLVEVATVADVVLLAHR